MKKILGAALLIGGIILLFFGYNEYNSLASGISETFTGSPTDNAIWYLTGGGVAAVAGLVMLLSGRKK
jgi:uncharacterized membrane protein YidH (DUF202 family)